MPQLPILRHYGGRKYCDHFPLHYKAQEEKGKRSVVEPDTQSERIQSNTIVVLVGAEKEGLAKVIKILPIHLTTSMAW